MKIKRFFKVVIFVLIFAFCFVGVQNLLTGDADTRDHKRIEGFFDEKENSLDAVFLGSSATYAFWTAPVAWVEYGLTVYSLSSSKQQILAAKYLIADARKTQPDALYIVNVASVTEQYNAINTHRLIFGYPYTENKYDMINYLSELGGMSFSDRMEFYFPIIRFHDRWSDLVSFDFKKTTDAYKSASSYKSFLSKVEDVSGGLFDYEETAPISETLTTGLNDLMDYCEQEQVKVLFVVTPQSLTDEEKRGQQNTVMELIRSRGFDVLNMHELVEEMDLDLTTDYYNGDHTNIHGSIKFTDYLSRYLIENYGFKDKRGTERLASWDRAGEKYYNLISPYLTEEDLKYVSVEVVPEETTQEETTKLISDETDETKPEITGDEIS
ncbi:MAG: hypothetical protein IJ491_06775 [Clostridia bacterium]|nr:hypothetical protein [Clostridia bacterium]